MSKDKAPRKYYANWMSLESTLELAKDCTPRAEWCDIQCFVEEQAYDALEAKLAECVSALEFYACKANWELSEITLDQDRKPFWYLRTEIKNDCEEFEDKDARGGKRAREVLARVKK